MLASFFAAVRSVRVAFPFSTTHADARRDRARIVASLDRLARSTTLSPRGLAMGTDLKNRQIAKQDAILAAPCRLTFPTFFAMDMGKNHIGLSLAGFRCNFPALAKRYGEELPYGGGVLGYRNWLGVHIDL
jgi:hypothetical protein